jgi:rhodanese-related sulfurtransferase
MLEVIKSMLRKGVILIIIVSFIGANSVNVLCDPIKDGNFQKSLEKEKFTDTQTLYNDYIDITVYEAWEMLNSTGDGKQILIDVRRWDEYSTERIKPPFPEDWPRWFPYELTSGGPGPIKNEGILLKIFMSIYKDKEIIIYCRTSSRSGIVAQILVDNGFQGIVYNMLGGINEWKAAGFPTVEGLFPFF